MLDLETETILLAIGFLIQALTRSRLAEAT